MTLSLSMAKRFGLTALELHQKISVKKAAELNNISEDTFRRRHKHLIKPVSPRRDAVELGDALAIGNRETE
jgi:hypothetical protein